MECFFAKDDRSAAMRGAMLVFVVSSVLVVSSVIGSGLFILASASREKGG
jgi:hypothetical protein